MSNYTASATVNALKVHACVNCAAVFRYVMTRDCQGQGGTEEKAQQALAGVVESTMRSGVDTHPCPTCGMVQPEMVGAVRKPSHYGQAVCAAIVAGVLAILLGLDVVHIATAAYIGATCYLLIALWAFKTASSNPNDRLEEQLQIAQGELEAEALALDTEGSLEAQQLADPARATAGGHPLLVGLLGLAVIGALMPEVVRMGNSWPANDRWYPAVVGPGDTSTYYFDKEIESIKGYWKGRCKAAVVNGKALGVKEPLPCKAVTKDNSWGNSISVKSSEKSESSNIYAEITLPDQQGLAGKKAQLKAAIIYQYPKVFGGGKFSVQSGQLLEETTLDLATPGAAGTYESLGWFGVAGGGVWLMLLGIWMARRAGGLQGNQHETFFFSEEEQGEEGAEPAEDAEEGAGSEEA